MCNFEVAIPHCGHQKKSIIYIAQMKYILIWYNENEKNM